MGKFKGVVIQDPRTKKTMHISRDNVKLIVAHLDDIKNYAKKAVKDVWYLNKYGLPPYAKNQIVKYLDSTIGPIDSVTTARKFDCRPQQVAGLKGWKTRRSK